MKNLSKLTKKVVADKNGVRRTVWVRTDASDNVVKDKKTEPTVKELEAKISILERQNIPGYKEWHELKTDERFAGKNYDIHRVQAFKKYKENLQKYIGRGSKKETEDRRVTNPKLNKYIGKSKDWLKNELDSASADVENYSSKVKHGISSRFTASGNYRNKLKLAKMKKQKIEYALKNAE